MNVLFETHAKWLNPLVVATVVSSRPGGDINEINGAVRLLVNYGEAQRNTDSITRSATPDVVEINCKRTLLHNPIAKAVLSCILTYFNSRLSMLLLRMHSMMLPWLKYQSIGHIVPKILSRPKQTKRTRQQKCSSSTFLMAFWLATNIAIRASSYAHGMVDPFLELISGLALKMDWAGRREATEWLQTILLA